MARRHGVEVMDPAEFDDIAAAVRDHTDGRGPDSVIDAVGMEAHGSPGASTAQRLVGLLPDRVAAPLMQKAGIDRLAALHLAIELVRRGGTISISGVYGGALDPMPMFQLFHKGVTLRMCEANVRAWTDALLALVLDAPIRSASST
jgi:threonine dehydrogenase-like Zn-dependent dehydrogenase